MAALQVDAAWCQVDGGCLGVRAVEIEAGRTGAFAVVVVDVELDADTRGDARLAPKAEVAANVPQFEWRIVLQDEHEPIGETDASRKLEVELCGKGCDAVLNVREGAAGFKKVAIRQPQAVASDECRPVGRD